MDPTDDPMDVDIDLDILPPPRTSGNESEIAPAAGMYGIDEAGQKFYITTFNNTDAGFATNAPPDIQYEGGMKYDDYRNTVRATSENPWSPFTSRMDWEVAKWAKLRGSTSTAFTELLAIDGLSDQLNLSYKNATELNNMIDNSLPRRRPEFVREEVSIKGKSFDLFKRDILKCIASIYGDPAHAQYLQFLPERHYADPDKTIRVYHELHTGAWWWATQKAVEKDKPGATIVPVILSTDKTQITIFRNKSAYPIYLTIGNLPKDIRRKPSKQGQILVGYLPTSNLKHIKNKASRRRAIANLFHACMSNIVAPLRKAGLDGVVLEDGNGVRRRCHPIHCAYVGDYPEHVLVTCTYTGTSPVCEAPAHKLGEYPCIYPLRDADAVAKAITHMGTDVWVSECRKVNIKPVQNPFWKELPYTNIFRTITPDVLHQLYQGVIKHLISWITEIYGEDDIDARASRLPPNHGIRVFRKGITSLSRVSGAEHKQMCAFLLSVVTDARLPGGQSSASLMAATRALLDFLYYARYPIHTEQSLKDMEFSLAEFHRNKHVFIDLGVRENFNIPKFHSLCHYIPAIKLYGTTDNYSTEATERLHIDLAKDAYRATNRKDEFTQMTRWLERREKVLFHANFIARSHASLSSQPPTHGPSNESQSDNQNPESLPLVHFPGKRHTSIIPRVTLEELNPTYELKMTNFPTHESVSLDKIQDSVNGYGATLFKTALARFIIQYRFPEYTARQIDERAHDIVKFINRDAAGEETMDSIHAYPSQWTRSGRLSKTARFDTAIVKVRDISGQQGKELHGSGLRVGRVRVIFSLPTENLGLILPPNLPPPKHLAYVEWFSNFTRHPEPYSHLYKLKKEYRGEHPLVSVLPLNLVKHSVHLYPRWDMAKLADWESDTVLDQCDTFYLNPYKDLRTYFVLPKKTEA
ncbi:hypothetical protein V5O48_009824 [Marasmius crinis-equi]|uniref:Uncharacterized protein n=1 Tax=Marasmius crinis-equi TaxID=585013 RepID=A0ABR3FA89_9AGAR